MVSPPRVFLSYAREDGETFATALRRRLEVEHPEIEIWQDLAEMEGGIGWWSQVEQALDQVRFLVIVLTAKALVSPNTQREWRHARGRGVNVYPVKGVPDDQLDYDTLPNWMRKAHFFDIGHWTGTEWRESTEWEKFVSFLSSDRRPPNVPFLAPDFPRNYVRRPREFDALVRAVLDPDRSLPTAITTALQGAGGYGKTTLAIALCHDERVKATFDDGVLWASLGQSPNVRDELARWYEALAGHRPAFLDVQDAATTLADKLEHRDCLLVIDDVWDQAHLEPFLRGGRQCARVVTTRRLDLLRGAARVRVDEMRTSEARELIGGVFPPGVVGAENLTRLAANLGEWPLLLTLAAAMIRGNLERGDSPEGALSDVGRLLDRHGVVAFDARDATRREEAVSRTVAASRSRLDADHDRRFLDLAIFPDEVAIPLTTLQRLWKLDDLETRQCARGLDDLALLSLDLGRGTVKLHDVMAEYLERQVSDLPAVHARLVANYGEVLHLPDAYAWRWLPYHLRWADQPERLHSVLMRPDWLQAQLQAVGPHAMLQAFGHAGKDPDLQLIRAVLRLSLPALAADGRQFCEQVLGRLPAERSSGVEKFKEEVERLAPTPRLRAKWPNLTSPGSLEQTFVHGGAVTGAVLLTDGRVLSWSSDRTLRVWDLEMGEALTLMGHTDAVSGALVLPDQRVLSWSRDATLRVWDVKTGEGRALTLHKGPVGGAVLMGNDRVLSWADDGTLRVSDVLSGDGRELSGHDGPIGGAILLPDERVLSWSRDTLRVRDLRSGDERELTGHQGWVLGALPLPNERVLSRANDGMLRVWNLITGDGHELTGHEGWVRGALHLPDSRVLSWGDDGTLRVWDLTTGDARIFTGHTGTIWGALLMSDGRVLSWSSDGTLRLWDLPTGDSRSLIGNKARVAGAMLLRNERILSWADDGTLRVWGPRAHDGRTLIGHEPWVTGALLLPDGRALSWGEDHTLRTWDVTASAGRARIGHQGSVGGALPLPKERVLSWAGDGTLRLWNLITGRERVLTGHRGWVRGAMLLPNERVLSWADDGTLRLWDLIRGNGSEFAGHQSQVNGALLLPDLHALSWADDGSLRLWNLITGEGRELLGHRSRVTGALLLPDGHALSWSQDETLRIWNLTTGEQRTLGRHDGFVWGALTLQDGRVLSWGNDGTVRVWDLATREGRVLTRFDSWAPGLESRVDGVLVLSNTCALIWNDQGILRMVDPTTGEERTLGHQQGITGALLMGIDRVLSWSYAGTLGLWDVTSGEGRSLTGHEAAVGGALLMPDARVVSWSTDRSVRCWDVSAGTETDRFYLDAAVRVAISVNRNELFVGDALGGVHFLELLN